MSITAMPGLSDRLAITRTALANERTLLAYVRTAFALGAGGFALVEFVKSPRLDVLGYAMLPGSGVLLIVGIWRYWRVRRNLAGICGSMVEEASSQVVAGRGGVLHPDDIELAPRSECLQLREELDTRRQLDFP